MQSLRVSAHERCGPASPLTFAKPLTYGRLVAHRYLIEGRAIADSELVASPLQYIRLYSLEISEKEIGKFNVDHREAQTH